MMQRYLDDISPQRDRWLLSYADLLTLLLAFFVVMYSVSAIDQKKLHEIANSIEIEMMGTVSNEIADVEKIVNGKTLDMNKETKYFNIDIPNANFKNKNNDWIEFTLDSEFLFASGKAELKLNVNDTLNDLLLVLNNTEGDVRVEGHTDINAISTLRFPSNWELSAARAAAVVRFFEAGGVDSSRLSATGFSSSMPIYSNSSSEGRRKNRRVVLKIRAIEEDLEKLDALEYKAIESEFPDTESQEDDAEDDSLLFLERTNINTGQKDSAGIDLDGIDPELLMQILNEIDIDAIQESP